VTSSLEILVLDVGDTFRGYDCRDVLRVEETGEEASRGRYVVRLGRLGAPRDVRCREILGSVALSAREIRPVPPALRDRMVGEKPWAVGITERGICLLY
jgi:hypothetical protein